jgi:hypothetical protein
LREKPEKFEEENRNLLRNTKKRIHIAIKDFGGKKMKS